MWKQTEPLYRTKLKTAWKQELFYSIMYPPNITVEWIDTDKPEDAIYKKDITYTFNEYGFRSDSFSERSDINILTCGCSHTVGVGVTQEESWPFVLKQMIKNDTNQSVSIYNVSVSGASTSYVSRSIYKTIDILKPDIVVIYWPPTSRIEAPSEPGDEFTQRFVGDEDYPPLFVSGTWLTNYNFLKDYVLVNEMLKTRNIPLITSAEDKLEKNHIGKDIVEIDGNILYEHFIRAKTHARDGQHPGPDWHVSVAKMYFDRIKPYIQ